MTTEAPFAVEIHPTRDAWLSARAHSIGGSDAPSILGKGFDSPFAWWAKRTGRLAATPDSRRMRYGKAAEDFIHGETERETGRALVHPGDYTIFRSTVHPGMHSTPDRLVTAEGHELAIAEDAGLPAEYLAKLITTGRVDDSAEFKTVGLAAADKWGDLPSEYAYIQVQHTLLVLGLSSAFISALVGAGEDFRVYRVGADPEMQAELAKRSAEMLERIRLDEPPAPDGSESSTAAVSELYHDSAPGKVIRLEGSFAEIAERIESTKAEIARLEETCSLNLNALKVAAGDAERVEIEGLPWAYSWKKQVRINPPRLEEQRVESRPFRKVKA